MKKQKEAKTARIAKKKRTKATNNIVFKKNAHKVRRPGTKT